MALKNLYRVFVAGAILFFFGAGLWALKHPGRMGAAVGLGSLALAAGTAAGVIRANYRISVSPGRAPHVEH
jgi:hypothetical protein